MLLEPNDIVSIVGAGGGVILDLNEIHYTVTDLVSIAGASRSKGAKIILRNLPALKQADLVSIAGAGGGNVIFELT